MQNKAFLLIVVTTVMAVAVYVIGSFLYAYPEGGPSGWFLVAGIIAIWAVLCILILRIKEKS